MDFIHFFIRATILLMIPIISELASIADAIGLLTGVNPGGLGVATPQILGRGGRGGGVAVGRGRVVKYYYYVIMYRKCVRKW